MAISRQSVRFPTTFQQEDPMRARLFISLIALGTVGCSSGGGGSAASAADGAARPARGSQNLITEAEIAQLGQGLETAFDLVERLRPSMLRSRASTFGNSQAGEAILVMAYVDDIRQNQVSDLRTVPRAQVKEIRYVSATDATQRWGTGHSSGAIHVITKK
jgi:hypothetical protein